MPGSLGHLTRRFFDVLSAQPLDAAEVAAVELWLDPGQAHIFFSQPDPDQRHGFDAATVVLAAETTDPAVLRAALLHDVGKRHARLGVVGRSVASVMIRLRMPLSRRGRLYRDHGETGAMELVALGAESLIVDFARNHHGARPSGFPLETWDLLQRADEPPKTRSTVGSRISWGS
ncbi:MAG: HDIG domain-containing metalloprotein [Acidimicrobiia bacterium]